MWQSVRIHMYRQKIMDGVVNQRPKDSNLLHDQQVVALTLRNIEHQFIQTHAFCKTGNVIDMCRKKRLYFAKRYEYKIYWFWDVLFF